MNHVLIGCVVLDTMYAEAGVNELCGDRACNSCVANEEGVFTRFLKITL